MEFIKYQHVERFGNVEVDGIEFGECYIFPKLDGTNASLWWDGELQAGSRNRHLSTESDNAGFYNTLKTDEKYIKLLSENPDLRLYGEWLVPHSLKTYDEDAWRKFYVFDVMVGSRYLHYNEYSLILDRYGIDYIVPLGIIHNGKDEDFQKFLERNTYLIKDGNGVGEGIVIKRYDFVNKYGRTTWAKIVTNDFKTKHKKVMGAPTYDAVSTPDDTFVDTYCTIAFVAKEFAKIEVEHGWSSKMIPRLFNTVYHELVTENIWDFIKKKKNPKMDFSRVYKLTIEKIKAINPELF